jgi:two-component system, chemotaxis family, protein-glutamate methylesterase/glutaminase
MPDPIKVLVVDDSSLVRKIITDILEKDPAIHVVGTANNGQTAVYRARELDPDVITMDIEMPIMDGLTALRQIIATHPKPVIMMSVLTQHGADATFKALEYGAVDFVPKPSTMLSLSVEDIGELLISKIKSVYRLKVRQSPDPEPPTPLPGAPVVRREPLPPVEVVHRDFPPRYVSPMVVGIGTSTGGPAALVSVFRSLPEGFPAPLLVVQHMPQGFTKAFAERLNSLSAVSVKEAEDNERVLPGHGYLAPGDFHMTLEKRGGEQFVRVYQGEKVSGHRPSIDVLFGSMAETCGDRAVAVIMTGMGRDGADGTVQVKKRGGYTIAQDASTSVVYGMNRVAVESGGVAEVLPLGEISKKIIEHI